MGLRCVCGVRTNPIAVIQRPVTVSFPEGLSTGIVTIFADFCPERPEISTVTITFVDTDNVEPNRNFVFTSTIINDFSCSVSPTACSAGVSGIGVVTDENIPRVFTLRFVGVPRFNTVTFDINEFASIPPSGPIQPLVTFIGCPLIS
jgi:hypothetical protein